MKKNKDENIYFYKSEEIPLKIKSRKYQRYTWFLVTLIQHQW